MNRILIVEDDPFVLKFLVRCAGHAGWEAVGVASDPEALKIFEVGRFKLLLSDINLNDATMDGIKVAKKLLSLEPGLHVALMSGDPANRDRVKEAGLGPLLYKPITSGTIADLLKRHKTRRAEGPLPANPNCLLLVEDDPATRELLAHYINSVGWKVVAVQNASEALQIFKTNKFNLLLADVMLHDIMDGIELAQRLKALEPDLRVVIISGAPGIDGRVKEAGLGPFLPKPLDLPALADLLELNRAHHEDGTLKHILIVEDDTFQLEEYSRTLEGKGYQVTRAVTAEEALTCLESRRFDVIITDNVLPGMTGLRAIPEFKKRSKAPILMMASHPSPDLEKDALLLGAAAFLQKPLNFDQVTHKINSFIS